MTVALRCVFSMVLVTMDRWDVKRLAKQSPGLLEELKALIEARRTHA